MKSLSVLKYVVHIVTAGVLLPIIRGNVGAKNDAWITQVSNIIRRLAIAVERNYLIYMKTEMAQFFVKCSSIFYFFFIKY
jgi:uncharacterized membrane protein (DUF441 family)